MRNILIQFLQEVKQDIIFHHAELSAPTVALTGHCVARRRRTCKEWNGIREGM
jgi:hypothetical protein